MIYLRLFFEFFKTGLFAVGGGLATIPFLSEMGTNTGWFTTTELTNMIAISESTPGPTGINMATYVGYTVGGPFGAIIATVGEVTPSIIIIVCLSKFLNSFKENKTVDHAMNGIRACSIGLIACAFLRVFTSSVIFIDNYKETGKLTSIFDLKIIFIFVLILGLSQKIKSHPITWIGLSAILGIILFSI